MMDKFWFWLRGKLGIYDIRESILAELETIGRDKVRAIKSMTPDRTREQREIARNERLQVLLRELYDHIEMRPARGEVYIKINQKLYSKIEYAAKWGDTKW